MSSRDIILKNLRNSRSIQTPVERPHVQKKIITNPIEMFRDACKKSNTDLVELNTADGIPQKIRNIIGCDSQLRMWEVYSYLDWGKVGISPVFGQAEKNDAYGLTGVSYGICATGTLVLQSQAHHPQSVAILPAHHFAVVGENQLVNRLSDVFDTLVVDKMSSQVIFISGPSRTADIEQTLILGAHGPLQVTVLLIPEV